MLGMSYYSDGAGGDTRASAHRLLDMCRDGALDANEVLEHLLDSWLSSDEANEFAEREYGVGEDGP